MPGAGDLIEALSRDGARLALGSSGPPENVALLLEHLPEARHLHAVVTGRDVRHGKPDPEVFLKAAGKLGLPPAACAVVEDSPAGLEAARRAGMTAIALVGTASPAVLEAQADWVTDALAKLDPARIRRLIARRNRQEIPP